MAAGESFQRRPFDCSGRCGAAVGGGGLVLPESEGRSRRWSLAFAGNAITKLGGRLSTEQRTAFRTGAGFALFGSHKGDSRLCRFKSTTIQWMQSIRVLDESLSGCSWLRCSCRHGEKATAPDIACYDIMQFSCFKSLLQHTAQEEACWLMHAPSAAWPPQAACISSFVCPSSPIQRRYISCAACGSPRRDSDIECQSVL